MKQLRKNIFETNSSSTHVLSIEGLHGIKPLLKTKYSNCYGFYEKFCDYQKISDLILYQKEFNYLQGINPIYAEPDLEPDRQYTKPLSKAKLFWTYLMQCNIADERLRNYIEVMFDILKEAETYFYKDYKKWCSQYLYFNLLFWTSDKFLDILYDKMLIDKTEDIYGDYYYKWKSNNFIFEPLSEYNNRYSDRHYSEELGQYTEPEYRINWKKKAKRPKNQVYTDTDEPQSEWGIFEDHYLAGELEVFDDVLRDKKILKAVILNGECIYSCKRIG